VLIVVVAGALLWRGTPRVRFAVTLLFAAVLPASFFTWGNVSRYAYVSAAAFALLLADGVAALPARLSAAVGDRRARAIAALVALGLAIRFAVYAEKSAWSFREQTVPFARMVEAVRGAAPSGADVVVLPPAAVADIEPAFRDLAAGAAFCGPPLHVVMP